MCCEIFNGYIVWGHAAAKFPDDQIDSDGALQGYWSTSQCSMTRLVFDCTARPGVTSLNFLLLPGPDLAKNLTGVLLRFRQEPMHCISDECWADVSLSLSRPFLLSSIKMSLVAIRRLFLRDMLTIKCQWPYLGYIVTLLHQLRPQENKWPHCKMKNENDRSRWSRFQTSYS